MKKWLYLSLISSLFLTSYGCSTIGSQGKSSGLLEPSSILRFSDIPVPAGFKALVQSSYSFETAGVRAAVLRYQGKADLDQVTNFYKEQMAMNNWTLLNITEYGERLMNFERDNETCIITISGKGNSVRLSISVGPRTQALPKKPRGALKEPIK